ncbi:MAG: DUF6502 family protein [Gammaproteobacteria bacterium]
MSTIIQKHLIHAFRKVLQPLVKLLVRAGVGYGEFSDLAKAVFVECALRDGLGVVTRPTRARVAAVTGVPRRDVDRVIDTDGSSLRVSPSVGGTMVEVLQKWHSDPRYTGPYGIPLELEFQASAGERSFIDLVSLVAPAADPKEILDELLRVGSVAYSGESHLRAVSRYFMTPLGMSSEQLEYFINTLTRLGQTLEFNMDPTGTAKRLERFVVADRGLPVDALAKFEEYVRQQSSAFLLDLDNWLSPYGSDQVNGSAERLQTGVHVFMYVEQNQQVTPLQNLVEEPTGDIRR